MTQRHWHPQELAFLDSIHSAPHDDAPRLIYADWLEEQGGQPEYADFIRIQCTVHKAEGEQLTEELLEAESAIYKRGRDGLFLEWARPYPHFFSRRPQFERGMPLCRLPFEIGVSEINSILESCSPRLRFIICVDASNLERVMPIALSKRIHSLYLRPEKRSGPTPAGEHPQFRPYPPWLIEEVARLPNLVCIEDIGILSSARILRDGVVQLCKELLVPLFPDMLPPPAPTE